MWIDRVAELPTLVSTLSTTSPRGGGICQGELCQLCLNQVRICSGQRASTDTHMLPVMKGNHGYRRYREKRSQGSDTSEPASCKKSPRNIELATVIPTTFQSPQTGGRFLSNPMPVIRREVREQRAESRKLMPYAGQSAPSCVLHTATACCHWSHCTASRACCCPFFFLFPLKSRT